MAPDRTYVPLQAWNCAKCGRSGEIEAPRELTLYQRFLRFREAHLKRSRYCHFRFGVKWVRVKMPARVSLAS